MKIQKKILAKLEKELEEMKEQEEMQYELLETKKYTQALFDKRNKALREKMKDCENQIYIAKRNIPKSVDYEERIATLKDVICSLRDNDISVSAKNEFLKKIVDRIECKNDDNGFSLDIRLKI